LGGVAEHSIIAGDLGGGRRRGNEEEQVFGYLYEFEKDLGQK
jgi:hypothetical protein